MDDLKEKDVLKKIEEDIADSEDAMEKESKLKTLSVISKAGILSTESSAVNVSNESGDMTSAMKTTIDKFTTEAFTELLMSTVERSRASDGFPRTSQPKTSFTSTTEGSQNSTFDGKISTAGVESLYEFTMLQDKDKTNYTKASNDSNFRTTTQESIHKITHQPLKSSASLSSFTIPLFITSILSFLLKNYI